MWRTLKILPPIHSKYVCNDVCHVSNFPRPSKRPIEGEKHHSEWRMDIGKWKPHQTAYAALASGILIVSGNAGKKLSVSGTVVWSVPLSENSSKNDRICVRSAKKCIRSERSFDVVMFSVSLRGQRGDAAGGQERSSKHFDQMYVSHSVAQKYYFLLKMDFWMTRTTSSIDFNESVIIIRRMKKHILPLTIN